MDQNGGIKANSASLCITSHPEKANLGSFSYSFSCSVKVLIRESGNMQSLLEKVPHPFCHISLVKVNLKSSQDSRNRDKVLKSGAAKLHSENWVQREGLHCTMFIIHIPCWLGGWTVVGTLPLCWHGCIWHSCFCNQFFFTLWTSWFCSVAPCHKFFRGRSSRKDSREASDCPVVPMPG